MPPLLLLPVAHAADVAVDGADGQGVGVGRAGGAGAGGASRLNTGCEADDEEAGSRDRNTVRRAVVWRVRTDRIAILEGIASVMLAVDSDSEGVKRAVTG